MRQQIHGDSALLNGIKVFMGEFIQAFSYLHFCICHVRMHGSSPSEDAKLTRLPDTLYQSLKL